MLGLAEYGPAAFTLHTPISIRNKSIPKGQFYPSYRKRGKYVRKRRSVYINFLFELSFYAQVKLLCSRFYGSIGLQALRVQPYRQDAPCTCS